LGGESICGAHPFQGRYYFFFTRERNAFGFAVVGANAAARDTVKRACDDRFTGGRVPVENARRAKVKAL
jgi:hypothetical protein